MAKNILSEEISEVLNGASRAWIDIHAGDGNLTIDGLQSSEHVLLNGSLEYAENQGLPSRHIEVRDGEVHLNIRGCNEVKPRFRMPWAACNGATNWLVHLNPDILSDITARSNGGNLKMDFHTMQITHLSADTGGGNIDILLPEKVAALAVNAKTGAGNVTVSIPGGVAARIHASTGLGKVIMDPRFSQVDKATYQSPDYEQAAKKVEITATSGAGDINVSVT